MTVHELARRPHRLRRRSLSRGGVPALAWSVLEAEAGTWWTIAELVRELERRGHQPDPAGLHRAVWRLAARQLVHVAHTPTGEALFGLPDRDTAEALRELYGAGLRLCRHGCLAGFPTEIGRRVHESRWCTRRAA